MSRRLRDALYSKCNEMMEKGITDLAEYEQAFQDVLEEWWYGSLWWELTSCNISEHLQEYKNPEKTVAAILKGIY